LSVVVPVAVAAYFYGSAAGLLVALFFSTAFWAKAYALFLSTGFSFVSAELIGITFVLFVLAYVVADVSTSVQSHSALQIAVRDREALLNRASNLNRVTEFVLREARLALSADQAFILLSNPLNGQWEVIGGDSKKPLLSDEQDLTLARWLIERQESLFLQDLDADDSILAPDQKGGRRMRSLLCRVLRHQDGTPLGCLVVVNERGENFSQSDLRMLDDLVRAGQKAMEQAGMYARTDYALEQRVTQLAAIQRTTRELNSNLDLRRIVDVTLHCAIEITGAEAGTVILDVDELLELIRTRALQVKNRAAQVHLEHAILEGRTPALSADEFYLPTMFPNSQSQLVGLIQQRGQTLGAIVVESTQTEPFEETSGWALSLLADHVAIALENSRLFAEIRKEKQRIGLIIDSIADGLITANPEGRIVTVNPEAQALTGWSAEELQGQPLEALLQPADEAEAGAGSPRPLQALADRRDDKMILRQRTGGRLVVSLSAAPVLGEDNQSVGMVIVFRDITQKEELDRLQQELIAAISHEMRTPLAKISSISETIESQLAGKLNEKQTEHLEILVAESQRLAKFMDGVLNVHHLETAKFEFQIRPVPLAFVLEQTLNHWRTAAPSHAIRLARALEPVWAWADENSLVLILNNLLDNAVKYSPAGTRVEIDMEIATEGKAVISVRDDGNGIPPEYQARIFDRFYRLNGGDAQVVYGHGLGLYITKILVGAMGGRIWVESEPGKGSRFAFTLPLVDNTDDVAEEGTIETQNPGD
ncbi:MAG TPA: ATP-binding protein, partial [Anaerolineaceae bacterium]|nr:ATP-binding protein [Anaerolineaceae bacterium]